MDNGPSGHPGAVVGAFRWARGALGLMGLVVGMGLAGGPGGAWAGQVLEVNAGPVSGETGVYRMDARVLVDVSPLAMRHVILHLCDHREHMPYLAYCRPFRNVGNQSWSYAVVDVPVIDPRDYVIVSTVLEDLAVDGSGTYRTRWDLDAQTPPRPRKGFLRLATNEGSWTLVPQDGGRKTLLEYHVKVAPGGIIPAWASAYVAKQTLPDYVATLERLARSTVAKGAVDIPVPGDPWATAPARPLDNPLPSAGPRKPPPLLPPSLP